MTAASKAESIMRGAIPVPRLESNEAKAVHRVVAVWLEELDESARPDELVRFQRALALAFE